MNMVKESAPRPGFPPLAVEAAHLAGAVARLALAALGRNPLLLSAAGRQARLAVCVGCAAFHAASGRCRECGCQLKLKLALRSEACPAGRWPPAPV